MSTLSLIPKRKSLLTTLFMSATLSAGLMAAPATSSVEPWNMGEPIVSYWAGPMPITEASAKQLADGHWNLVPIGVRGKPAEVDSVTFVTQQLDLLQKHGLRGMISTWRVFGLDTPERQAEFKRLINAVKAHPAFYAYSIKDEPGAALFPTLQEIREFILKHDTEHLIFVNLYPIGASNQQLGTEGDPEAAYVSYLGRYIQDLQPQLLSYDHYHFGTRGDGRKFFLNLALMRQASIDTGIPYMVIVQACSWTTNMRIPTGEELSWLTYTTLAYGARGIAHYVYSYPGHDGGMAYLASTSGRESDGTVTIGKPTPLYYYARELNREFVAISRELSKLTSTAVYHLGTIPEGGVPLPDDAPFQVEPPIASKELPPPGQIKRADEEALFDQGGSHGSRVEGYLLGCFGKSGEPTHALIVNLDYRTFSGRGHARESEFPNSKNFGKIARHALKAPGPIEVFDPATGQWHEQKADQVEINLPPGAGLLVRLKP